MTKAARALPPRRRRGVATILAMILIVVFAALALAAFATSNTSVLMANNYRSIADARMAAESGLSYMLWALDGCRSGSLDSGKPDMLGVVYAHLVDQLAGSNYQINFVGQNLDPEDPSAQRFVTLSDRPAGGIGLSDGRRFSAKIYTSDVGVAAGGAGQDAAETIVLGLDVTGQSGAITRTVGINMNVRIDKTILQYAIASTPRVIIRGKANIGGDVCTSWRRIVGSGSSIAWPLDIGSPTASERAKEDIRINGRVVTTLTENRFDGTINSSDPTYDPHADNTFTHDSWQAVRAPSVTGQVGFEEPALVDAYAASDFDTSVFRNRSDQYVLHTPKSAQGDTTASELFSSGIYITRAVYSNYNAASGAKAAFSNLKIPKGRQAHFKNCIFKGVTYVETDEATTGDPARNNANNIVFENCTFDGPIVTGVAKKFAWDKNSIMFTGNTTFHSSMIQQTLAGTTILAPNFNINIGDFNQGAVGGDSKIVGILVGGIVDIRDNAVVQGTILSMANLDSLAASQCYLYGSNVGNWEGGGETTGGGGVATSTISITPDPGNVMPLGIKKKYTLSVDPSSYFER